ncbi:hypothetical protein A2U01_0066675, partial [Trifolium medium]|nr:hypothetical protein [Trifolium medium]
MFSALLGAFSVTIMIIHQQKKAMDIVLP